MSPANSQNLDSGCSSNILLRLEISDPDVVSELNKYQEIDSREKYAVGALRLGVLALRQASGELDAAAIRNAAQNMLADLGQMLTHRGLQISTDLSGTLRQYFDPSTGALTQRIDSLIRNDGELDRALRAHLGSENSTIAQALSAHFGEGSPISRLLSPTDANGVKAQVESVVEAALQVQRDQILNEFSLNNKESALSRLIAELTSSNGTLKSELQGEVDKLACEFSLDKPDSALSRLVARVENAHQAITDEFSADNENSAIVRLSRMLEETRQQIDKNLTLDDEGSALSRVKRELTNTIESLATTNASFQTEVRATLAALQARKQEAARSTRHGHEFEAEVGMLLATEAQRLNDPYESVGATTGAIKNCKTGDFVTTLGPDSAAPGARIVWEAKEDGSYDLKQALAETAMARKNRQAQIGVFVFSTKTVPDTLQPFARYGNDIIITWDAESVDSDLRVRVAYSVARALVIRETHESVESDHALKAIDIATRSIEKQLDNLEQIKIWAETVRSNGEKVVDRATRMRADLSKEIEALDRQVNGLRTCVAQAA